MTTSLPRRNSLTHRAQQAILPQLNHAHVVVDATAGNGRDTAFLAQHTPDDCRVFACDIQAEALTKAREYCALWSHKITWLHASHAQISDLLPPAFCGSIDAVMFNLGYLPGGGNKHLCTQSGTTVVAIERMMAWLANHGVISLLCYTGHAGGLEEYRAIQQAALQWQAEGWQIECFTPPTHHPSPPHHLLIHRSPT